MDFSAHIPCVKKRKFSPRIWTWKLRDPTTAILFQSAFKVKTVTAAAAVAIASGADADTANHVESAWSKLKGPLLDTATEVCSISKNHQWKPEASMPWTKEAWRRRPKTAYIDAKHMAKHAVWLAKSEVEKEEFTVVSPDGDGVFCIAKQMDCRKQDITCENCVRNDAGELAPTDENQMKAWVEHYAGLLKVEFVWPSNELPQVTPTDGPPPSVSATQIGKGLSKMKCSRAAGPSQVMLKAAGEEGVELTRKLTKAVFSCGAIPSDSEESFIMNLYKGKGEDLDRGNYHGLKLTDQVMKLLERVLDFNIPEMVNIDEMQFGFVPARHATDAIFIVRQLQEKYIAAKKLLYIAFVDLERAFDHVPRKVIWWVLRSLGGQGMGCAGHPGHVLQGP